MEPVSPIVWLKTWSLFHRWKTRGLTGFLWKSPTGGTERPVEAACVSLPATTLHPKAERLTVGNLAARWGLFADEMELCRRDARRRR